MHVNKFDLCWKQFVQADDDVGRYVFGVKTAKPFRQVPGWNSYLKDFDDTAREAFLSWRHEGSQVMILNT